MFAPILISLSVRVSAFLMFAPISLLLSVTCSDHHPTSSTTCLDSLMMHQRWPDAFLQKRTFAFSHRIPNSPTLVCINPSDRNWSCICWCRICWETNDTKFSTALLHYLVKQSPEQIVIELFRIEINHQRFQKGHNFVENGWKVNISGCYLLELLDVTYGSLKWTFHNQLKSIELVVDFSVIYLLQSDCRWHRWYFAHCATLPV